ncbi:MAG: hypothetical protein GY904_32110 [Planctomycetaceae bacterium]|nr:hypothetical protein [Planctomycetaceae bacterium]
MPAFVEDAAVANVQDGNTPLLIKTPAFAGFVDAIGNKNVRVLSDLMHPLLWEYMKNSQQSDYNRNSLIKMYSAPLQRRVRWFATLPSFRHGIRKVNHGKNLCNINYNFAISITNFGTIQPDRGGVGAPRGIAPS